MSETAFAAKLTTDSAGHIYSAQSQRGQRGKRGLTGLTGLMGLMGVNGSRFLIRSGISTVADSVAVEDPWITDSQSIESDRTRIRMYKMTSEERITCATNVRISSTSKPESQSQVIQPCHSSSSS